MPDHVPFLCFYGDDFTGSTDALDALAGAGLKAILFLSLPSEEMLVRFANADAIGIAGMTRAMPTDAMAATLRPILRWMARSGASVLHYKVCSTFDSSARIGSIGKVMDIAAEELRPGIIPIIVGVPKLGRYCAFGNLFARAGSNPEIFRLDRHPVMSRHPVTPMHEADLRRHLRDQTDMAIDLVPLIELRGKELIDLVAPSQSCRALLFDTVDDDDLRRIGRHLVSRTAMSAQPIFCIGSSAVEYALSDIWPRSPGTENAVLGTRRVTPQSLGGTHDGPIAVVSGSCSSITARQIDAAVAGEFEPIHIAVDRLASRVDLQGLEADVLQAARMALNAGRSPIIYTAHGAANEEIARSSREGQGASIEMVIGQFLGRVLRSLTDATGLKRVAVAGGDTSGLVTQALGLEALEVAASISPGAPLCRGYRGDGGVLEIALKGGQMGQDDYFLRVKTAQPVDAPSSLLASEGSRQDNKHVEVME